MLDFTSALYLGLRHPSGSLGPWEALTLGRPAALEEPAAARAVAAELAALQGCERAVLMPSTLHVFLDLFELLADGKPAIYRDAGSYPIACWGAERAAARGALLRVFPHHDPAGLRRALARDLGRDRVRTGDQDRRPVVLADGYSPVCGGPAPLAEYLEALRPYGGLLVIDDTQALGILGRDPGPGAPYGREGGGSLRRAGLAGSPILVGASLAKGFGTPIAALAGSAAMIGDFTRRSASRIHCSPPSAAAVAAAAGALALNRRDGDGRRLHLAGLVRRFRTGLTRLGLAADGGAFPVQTLRPLPGVDPLGLYWALWERGVRSVPLRRRDQGGARLGFLITAGHRPDDIDQCLAVLAQGVRQVSRGEPRPCLRLAAPKASPQKEHLHHKGTKDTKVFKAASGFPRGARRPPTPGQTTPCSWNPRPSPGGNSPRSPTSGSYRQAPRTAAGAGAANADGQARPSRESRAATLWERLQPRRDLAGCRSVAGYSGLASRLTAMEGRTCRPGR